MAGVRLHPGEIHFAVEVARAEEFAKDAIVDTVDRRGDPLCGKVKRVLPGIRVALVVLEDGP